MAVTVSDSLGWNVVALSTEIATADTASGYLGISLAVPDQSGSAVNKITVTAQSTQNPASVDIYSFYVIPYSGHLIALQVLPDEVMTRAGESLTFQAVGYDSLGQPVTPVVQWQAAQGTIDADGVYTAPEITGLDTIDVKTADLQHQKHWRCSYW